MQSNPKIDWEAMRPYEVGSHVARLRTKSRDVVPNLSGAEPLLHELSWDDMVELSTGGVGWAMGFKEVGEVGMLQGVAADRSLTPILHIRINFAASRLELESVSDSHKLECFEYGEWRPLDPRVKQSKSVDKQKSNNQMQMGLKQAVLSHARQSIKVLGEHEFEIIMSRMRDRTPVLRRAVESCLPLLLLLGEETFFQQWKVRIPTQRIRNLFMVNPDFDTARLAGLPALLGDKQRLVKVKRVPVVDKDQEIELNEIHRSFEKWFGSTGVQKTIAAFYEQIDDLRFEGIYYVVTPPDLGNFHEVDWTAMDSGTRFALFFTSLQGLYNLHENGHIHAQGGATASNIFVMSQGAPTPVAVISGFRPITTKQRKLAIQSKLEDLQQWARVIVQVLGTIHGYKWPLNATDEQVKENLKHHEVKVAEDKELVVMLVEALTLPDAIKVNKSGLGHERKARHLLRFPCWQPGLGERWIGLYSAFHSQFPQRD